MFSELVDLDRLFIVYLRGKISGGSGIIVCFFEENDKGFKEFIVYI